MSQQRNPDPAAPASEDYTAGVVAILDKTRTPVGTGFVATRDGLIVTCAHVLDDAGWSFEQWDEPVSLRFHANCQPARAFVLEGCFRASTAGDVAVLALDGELPEEVEPLPLANAEGSADHAVKMLGYPEKYRQGLLAKGEVFGLIEQGRTLQLWSEQSTHGYSGGPVWDAVWQRVIGIVKAGREADKAGRHAFTLFAVPTEILVDVCDRLAVTEPESPTVLEAAARRRYHQRIVDRLTDPAFDLRQRFVQLTLIVDRGAETQSLRYEPSTRDQDRYDDLGELLRAQPEPALVLLGAPGSGKTVLLQRLQLEQALGQLAEDSGRFAFFVRLNTYRDSAVPPLAWLQAEWRARHPALPPLDELLREQRLLLLLDGLNEMPHRDQRDYRERVGQWSAFLDRHFGHGGAEGSRAIFSCRTLDYSAALSERCQVRVQQVQVEPLSEKQIRAFLRAYRETDAEQIWARIEPDPRQVDLFSTPFFLKLLVDQAGADGALPAGRAALLTGFVRQTLTRELGRSNRLLEMPDLLSEDDRDQIERGRWGRSPYALPREGQLLPGLVRLAYGMQAGWGSGPRGQVSVPKTEARQFVDHERANDILEAGAQLNILDEEEGLEIRFLHQLLQEYFAARALAANPEPERVRTPQRVADVQPTLEEELATLEKGTPLPALPSSGWEETTVLAAAMHRDPARFIRDLMGVNLPLAGRCGVEVRVGGDLRRELQEALVAMLSDEAYDLRARVAAAEVLGELGDIRFERGAGPAGDAYLLPPFVRVPAGTYTIGEDDSPYAHEKPAHSVDVAEFEFAVYPVTNAEYRLFLEVGGYENEQWWKSEAAHSWQSGKSTSEARKMSWHSDYQFLRSVSEEKVMNFSGTEEQIAGWLTVRSFSEDEFEDWLERTFPSGLKYREPAFWNDSRFNSPNQPVVGICWYEARAYCAWLSAQTGQRCALSTEAEWEAATRRARTAWRYPYGPDFQVQSGATEELHWLRTTPVGVFPPGCTPEGIHDLSGNVWEWTTTLWGEDVYQPDFKYPYRPVDGRENLEAPMSFRRVVRGGSWGSLQYIARSACRVGSLPYARLDNNGFRLVRRPPSQ